MVFDMSTNSGPKSIKGKQISSRNSQKHGINARNWLSETEKNTFKTAKRRLIKEHQPKGLIEEALIDKIARAVIMSDRINDIEDAQYKLAREKASEPQAILDHFELEDEKELIEDYAKYMAGEYSSPKEFPPISVLSELFNLNPYEIQDWLYLETELPELKTHIINCAIKAKTPVDVYIADLREVVRDRPVNYKRPIRNLNPEDLTDPLKQIIYARETRPVELQFFAEHMLWLDTKRNALIEIIELSQIRSPLLKAASSPPEKTILQINRQRNAANKQFSTSVGELLEVQKRRRFLEGR